MNKKTQQIIYWTLTGLVSFVFLGSSISKFTANEEALKMAINFGLDSKTFLYIGLLELACLILFIIPKTGVLGTVLLAAYMGGAIATHLEHGHSIIAPCIVQSFMLLVAFYRFPELRAKLFISKA